MAGLAASLKLDSSTIVAAAALGIAGCALYVGAAAAVTGGVTRPKVLSDDFKRAIVREMQMIAQEMNNPNPSLERDQFIRMFMDHGMDENLANG
jgi:hypothetical protein